MNRRALLLAVTLLCAVNLLSQPWKEHGRLMLSADGHYIRHEDETSFFWLGDTGWELVHRLNREETDFFLESRRKQGFNVIQTVAISEWYREKPTNYYGDSLFHSLNPLRPAITTGARPEDNLQYDFWDHLDYAVSMAGEKGLYVALVPTWGEWVIPRASQPLFNTGNEAYQYGWFIGNRYKTCPNLIWVLGGDRHPDERAGGIDLWRAMAEGITDGTNGVDSFDGNADYTTTFMTHHSYNSSSNWFHGDPWIDFHMWGSYHADVNLSRAYELALADWHLPDPKPSINAEPCYEGHGINYAMDDNGYFNSTDVRTAAYWSAFSGTAGFTYGAHPVWQFTDSLRPKYSAQTLTSWQKGIEYPGAEDVVIMKKLMESRPMNNLVPDPSLIISGQGSGSGYIAALRGSSHAFVYIPTGNKTVIRLGVITGSTLRAFWFNPRTGSSIMIGEFENKGEKAFEVPGMSEELTWLRSGRGCDWVLLMDDASKGFPEPGN